MVRFLVVPMAPTDEALMKGNPIIEPTTEALD